MRRLVTLGLAGLGIAAAVTAEAASHPVAAAKPSARAPRAAPTTARTWCHLGNGNATDAARAVEARP